MLRLRPNKTMTICGRATYHGSHMVMTKESWDGAQSHPYQMAELKVSTPVLAPSPTARKLVEKEMKKLGVDWATQVSSQQGGYTIGTDPEVFIISAQEETKGQVIPAYKVLPPQKRPLQSSIVESSTAYSDGFGAELSAYHGYCYGYLVDNLRLSLKALFQHLDTSLGKGKYTLLAEDVKEVPPQALHDDPEEDVQLGCSPSLSAYDDSPEIPYGRSLPWRTLGTHFHWGHTDLTSMSLGGVKWLVRCVDFAHVLLTAAWGEFENPLRRTLYGRAGEFRRPTYGLEYRVAGSCPMRNPVNYHLAASVLRQGLRLGTHFFPGLPIGSRSMVRGIINNSDPITAREFIKKHHDTMMWVLTGGFCNTIMAQRLMNILLSKEGWKGLVDMAPDQIRKTWCIDTVWHSHSNADRDTVGGVVGRS
jgi:hypothetical protein